MEVNYLIISNKFDFATDYICIELEKRQTKYLRINRDQFEEYKILFDFQTGILNMEIDNVNYIIKEEKLKTIYYRAPTFLRETFLRNNTIENQLYSSQWMSFVRNLTYFENIKWMNNPNNTYSAENKFLQLKIAKEIGFAVPETIIANCNPHITQKTSIIKSIDTTILKKDNLEGFFYTNIIDNEELNKYNLSLSPFMIQEFLKNKIDIRITVIGNKIFPVEITSEDGEIKGDWRKTPKNKLVYKSCNLPGNIEKRVEKLVRHFKLNFAGIDLIYSNNEYYFIEINPTGEWAWLQENTNLKIDKTIVDWIVAE